MDKSVVAVPASVPVSLPDPSPAAWLASLVASGGDPCDGVSVGGILKLPNCAAE